MSTEIERDVVEEVSDLLQMGGQLNTFELAARLRQYRNEWHPDRFQDDALKVKAGERFKEVQSLLDKLELRIEAERFSAPSSELMLHKPLYDGLSSQREIDALKRSLEQAVRDLERERALSAELQGQVNAKEDERLAAEIEHLKEIYRPSRRGVAQIGLVVVLSGVLAVMSQMERVSEVLAKYAPFDSQYVSTGLFVLLIALLATTARKAWESSYVARKSEEVCSPRCAEEFMQGLRQKQSNAEPVVQFSEVEVFDFIYGRRTWLTRVATLAGFKIFRRETANSLKDIFLHNLLNKKLIEFASARGMQRHFRIIETETGDFWYRAYARLKTKYEGTSDTDEL